MPVVELLARTSGRELTDWEAFEEQTGPLDPRRRGDIGAGIVAAAVTNAMRAKKGKRFKPEDFIPRWGGSKKQSWQEQLAVVEGLNKAMKGRDLRKGG